MPRQGAPVAGRGQASLQGPVAARRGRKEKTTTMKHNPTPCALLSAVALLLAALAAPARAEEPKFQYADDEVKSEVVAVQEVAWKASAQAGLILTTGNADTTTLSATAKASRKANRNKFQLELGGAYARSNILLAVDGNGNGTIDDAGEIDDQTITTTRSWNAKGRYDRFLSQHNALYVTAVGGADVPAGKDFVGGGQIGYSRLLLEKDGHELSSEVGYDFSYEDLSAGDGVAIHSLRLFVGYSGKLGEQTGVEGSVEGLFNGNTLDTPTGEAGVFEDTRLNAKLSLTTQLFQDISFRFGFEGRFDNVPAPQPPFGIPYAPGFLPVADELDTRAEASLIINFL